MSKMLKRIPVELMVASSLLLAPGLTLTGYGQNNQPSSTPPSSAQPSSTPPSSTPPSSTPPSSTPPSSTPPSTSAPDATVPSADGKMPGIKPGSVDDVSAVGTRDIGGRGMGNWYSTETEIRMGKSYAMQLEKSVKFVNDPVVTEYVNRVAQNLVKNSDAKVPFTIKVIDSDEVNAMALPAA